MDENDKKKAVAIGAALFLFAAAFGFAVAAMQAGATDAGDGAAVETGDNINDDDLSDAESRIRDADMAREMMDGDDQFQQADAMLAQANQQPQGVLQLLR